MNVAEHLTYLSHSKTVRLALSYLAIIVILSVGFSVVFYHTSTGALDTPTLQVQDGKSQGTTSSDSSGVVSSGGTLNSVSMSRNSGPTVVSVADAAHLNAQLQESLHTIRANL